MAIASARSLSRPFLAPNSQGINRASAPLGQQPIEPRCRLCLNAPGSAARRDPRAGQDADR